MGPSSESTEKSGNQFRTTHWSVVLSASQRDAPDAQQALAQLCKVYWYPLYAYVRRRGHSPHDAEDLTQAFFVRLVEKNYLDGITREGGRFRSYLLTALKHFLSNEWERARAEKRGGGNQLLSLDDVDPEARYKLEPSESPSAEALFDRRWALTVLEQVMVRLQDEYVSAGKGSLFAQLQPLLSGEKQSSGYAELGKALGLSEGAVKVAVHRLRKRYGQLLREEISQTVALPEEIESEIRYLISAATR